MKCCVENCDEDSAGTVRLTAAEKPYWEDKPFCAEHGKRMRQIGFDEGRGSEP